MARQAENALTAQNRARRVDELVNELFTNHPDAITRVVKILRNVGRRIPQDSTMGMDYRDPNEIVSCFLSPRIKHC